MYTGTCPHPSRCGTTSMNLLPLVSLLHYPCTDPFNSGDVLRWWLTQTRCIVCSKTLVATEGIICTNYGMLQSGFPPCRHRWCAKCYTAHPKDDFPVNQPVDWEGLKLIKPGDLLRFRTTPDGNHLCQAFQCDLCEWRDMYFYDPLGYHLVSQTGIYLIEVIVFCRI